MKCKLLVRLSSFNQSSLSSIIQFPSSTDLIATASILDAPEDDAAFGRGGHHLVLVSVRAAHHLGIQRDAFNGPVKAGRGEHLLPSGRFLYPVKNILSAFEIAGWCGIERVAAGPRSVLLVLLRQNYL